MDLNGKAYTWEERGESSEGCIMWLADQFATQKLGPTAREIYPGRLMCTVNVSDVLNAIAGGIHSCLLSLDRLERFTAIPSRAASPEARQARSRAR